MGYYLKNLSGTRLRKRYKVAPARVKQYLDAEVRFVMDRLEPGCGFGVDQKALVREAVRVARPGGQVL